MIFAYILIFLLIVAVAYLWLELKKVKENQISLTEKNGEVVLTYKTEEIINYKLQKK